MSIYDMIGRDQYSDDVEGSRSYENNTSSDKKGIANKFVLGVSTLTLLLSSVGCAGHMGSFTNKAYRLEQQGKNEYLGRKVREIERLRMQGRHFEAGTIQRDLQTMDVYHFNK